MKLIGFNFSKVHAEKSEKSEKPAGQGINVKSNIDISKIYEVKSEFIGMKESLVGVKFSYAIDYNPDFAKILFEGTVLFSTNSKELKEILNVWKDKKVQEDFKIPLFNTILKKSNIKALYLEEELNLPTHMPMPSIKSE